MQDIRLLGNDFGRVDGITLLGRVDGLTLLGQDDFGWSLNPVSAIKRVASGAVGVAKKVGSGAVTAGKYAGKAALTVGKVALAPVWYLNKAALDLALRPVRSRAATLVARRASKLAWDRRRVKTPTPAESAEAREWTKNKFRAKGPHGHLFATLMGTPLNGLGGSFHLGAAPAIIAAAIPALTAIAIQILQSTQKSGEAPIDPAAGGAPPPEAAAPAPAPVPDYIPEPMPEAMPEYVPEYVPEPLPAPTEGYYFGAPPVDNKTAIVLALLGAVTIGGGAYFALRRR
jgi:hypothetical protein